MADDNNLLGSRVEAIKQLLDAFKYERLVYLIVTILSLIVLFACAVIFLIKGEIAAVIGLVCSSGAITYTAGRVLRMWSEALRILSPIAKEKKDE